MLFVKMVKPEPTSCPSEALRHGSAQESPSFTLHIAYDVRTLHLDLSGFVCAKSHLGECAIRGWIFLWVGGGEFLFTVLTHVLQEQN